MDQIQTTITLRIGKLDKEKNGYPFELISSGSHNPEASPEWIGKGQLDQFINSSDPVNKFLDETGESEDFLKIGQDLFDLFHQNGIAERWQELRKEHERLRIELEIIPQEIAAFPWELVSEGINRLAMDPDLSIIRKFTPKKSPQKDSTGGPLRVLILIGAKENDPAVAALPEVEAIESEILRRDENDDRPLIHRMIDIKVVRNPAIADLLSEYDKFQPHIFHFIGHGEYSGNQGCLIINVLDKNTQLYDSITWPVDQIITSFKKRWKPRFVFINACRSDVQKTPSEDLRLQSWSIGDAFRELGVPGTLTMQADIDGKFAGIFAGAVYRSLAELKPIDEAVSIARNKIEIDKNLNYRDWAVPVLMLGVPPEDVFPRSLKAPAERLAEIKECQTFRDIALFANCAEARRKLIRGVYPVASQRERDLLIVKGENETGKSWLAKWCMEVCALLNHEIRYVEVSGIETRTWLDVLLQIRDGDTNKKDSLIHRGLSESAFYRFNWELEHRFRGEVPPTAFDNSKQPARMIKLSDTQSWTPNFEVETLESFQKAIVQAAEINNPLIIVLDHFTKARQGVEGRDVELLVQHLVVPAAKQKFREELSASERRTVKFVLVLTEKEFKDFNIKESVSDSQLVSLQAFDREGAKEMMLEYLRYRKPSFSASLRRKYVDGLEGYLEEQPAWTPKDAIDLILQR